MKTKVLMIAAVALLLAGCSGAEETPAPETAASTAKAQAAYLDELFAAIPDHARATNAQWLDVGTAICDAYKEGVSPNQVIDSMQGTNLNADEAAALVVVSANTLCPEFA